MSKTSDSISVSVFGPSGDPVYVNYTGKLRANETVNPGQPNNSSLYRVASVTKLFTAMEILRLSESGYLDMDADISDYLPNFKYPKSLVTWREKFGFHKVEYNPSTSLNENDNYDRITSKNLLNHMGGLLRDSTMHQKWPPFNYGTYDLIVPNVTSQIYGDVGNTPLANDPSTWPAYSNVAFFLLQEIIENVYSYHQWEQLRYDEIIKEDILDPLKMTSSYFKIPSEARRYLSVPSAPNSSWADIDLTISNAAFGLTSTLGDLTRYGQALLSNYHGKGKKGPLSISSSKLREWMQSHYVFDDNLTATGGSWEIFRYPPSVQSNDTSISSRRVPTYSKSGSLPGYFSYFALDPARQFGVVVLGTGKTYDMSYFVGQIMTKFGATFSEYRASLLSSKTGTYCLAEDPNNSHGNSFGKISVKLEQDSFWVDQWTYNGVDMLNALQLGSIINPDGTFSFKVNLWPSSERDIYHVGLGGPPIHHFDGCSRQFANMAGVFTTEIPADMVIVTDEYFISPSVGLKYAKAAC